jgi:ribosomal protein L11 methyltransferase
MQVRKSEVGYLQVSIIIPSSHEELLSNFIIEEVANGLVTEDLDDDTKIICYIPIDNGPYDKLDAIKRFIIDRKMLSINQLENKFKSKTIKDIDWIIQYQKEFKSAVIDDLVIKTPWDETSYSDKKVITIMPKMAFGTGKHETTQLCIQAVKSEVKPGMKILDLGTGSGILSIYAAMLGATEILGVDNDPDAIPNAIENAALNNISEDVYTARTGSMEQVTQVKYYDMVISNLIKEGILELFDRFVEVLKPGGTIILSGLLVDQKNEMTEYFENKISSDMDIIQLNEWLCYILRTK